MTVNYLWSVLEEAECGRHVGMSEFQNKTIAIDLSVWICEGLTSPSLNKYHKSPALFLTFSRISALLKLGVRPIVCVEGKKRSNCQGVKHKCNDDSVFKITEGRPPNFTKANEECAHLLKLLGCAIIKADFEAEALAGQLSANGKVDGGKS